MAGFTLSEEQFNILMGRLAGGVGGGQKLRLNPRWMKLNDFSGSQSDWNDWAFGFKRAIRGADLEVFDIMERVERANIEFDEDELNQFTENGDVSKISGELYDLLCTVVKDEAMAVVRSVDEFRGFKAWYKLHMKYNPRTMARAIKLMGEVSSPGQVKNVSEVEGALTKWISKVKMLEKQFGETVGDKMKIAIMTSMLPSVIQDFVYQNVNRDTLFEGLLEKIGVWVNNRVAMNEGGTPMDVGEVDWNDNEGNEHVDAVGAWTRCNRCEGWGHIARDCPTKGKGKGGDYAKGGGKGSYGYMGGGKGDGKNNQYKATARGARA